MQRENKAAGLRGYAKVWERVRGKWSGRKGVSVLVQERSVDQPHWAKMQVRALKQSRRWSGGDAMLMQLLEVLPQGLTRMSPR